ncbi:hypothetical protein ACFLSP_00265 [Bacteroidota bacterium]
MPEDARSIYQRKNEAYQLETDQIRKRTSLYSLLRLLLFVLAIFFIVIWIKSNLVLAIISSLSSISLLLILVRHGSKLATRKHLLRELIRINTDEIAVLDWSYEGFQDGSEFQDHDHPNTSDLDIFGPNSLFQYLNRTSISKGGDRLAGWLSNPSSAEKIHSRQAAVEELSARLDWRQDFLARGRMSEETREDFIQLQRWLEEKSGMITSRFYRIILLVLPFLTLLSLILAFRWIPYNIPIFLVLVQLGIVSLNLRQINHHHNQVSRKFNMINKFSSLIKLIEEEDFSSEYLRDLRSGLSSSGIRAGEQLNKLARLVIQFDRRLNMIMAVVLNGVLMWDIQCVSWLEKWKELNAKEVPGWFDVLGKFEALNSFANFRFNNPHTVYPEIMQEDNMLEAEDLGHPLIPEKENIRNNLRIHHKAKFMLITGSNMAGKSTFLRTIGVNMVLANAGAPVHAAKMKWQPVRILSSMRVKDSLSNRESTFYAELKRLRMIVDVLKTGEKVLVILDEILKGTNSRDKHFGSVMFIRQLLKEDCSGLIATHDLELSKLEEEFPGQLLNYCFEVQIDDEEFIFDYKLRRGVCQTLNATELMKKMGISIKDKT